MKKFAVYTAITDGYDALKNPPASWKGQAEFIAFLESPKSASVWTVRPIYNRFKDSCRNAKIHKVLSHRYFPDAEYSLWIDGSVLVNTNESLKQLVKMFLNKHDMAVFKHYVRNCIYQEAATCIRQQRDDPGIINRQMQKYLKEGYPPDHGLAECSVLLRRHTKQICQFNETWYAEIRKYSRRDQLSFNYVAHKLGVKYQLFPETLINNPYFVREAHRSAI